MGATATAAQILIIRELLVVFYGSELAIGIILANWLLLEAGGSFWARKPAAISKIHVSVFAILQVCIGLGCLLSILFIRSFKYIFLLSTGEILGLEHMFIISLLALAPVAILDGALFPFGCKGLSQISRYQKAAGRVYLYQALGSFAAALFFVFFLIAWFNTLELASLLFFINCCSAYLYLSATGQAGWIKKSVAFITLLIFGMPRILILTVLPPAIPDFPAYFTVALTECLSRTSRYGSKGTLKNRRFFHMSLRECRRSLASLPRSRMEAKKSPLMMRFG